MDGNKSNNTFHGAVIKPKQQPQITRYSSCHISKVSPRCVMWHRRGVESYSRNKPKSTVDATFTNIR
jgi:hypothetical protein